MSVLEEVARTMFDAYNAQGPNPNKTWDGKDVPPWEALNDQVRGKWKAAASIALRHTPAAIAEDAVVERNRAAWEETLKRNVAPLVEQIAAAEKDAQEHRARCDELTARLEAKQDKERAAQLDEIRRRFRASLVAQLLSTGEATLQETRFDQEHQTMLPDSFGYVFDVVDAVLKKAGL